MLLAYSDLRKKYDPITARRHWFDWPTPEQIRASYQLLKLGKGPDDAAVLGGNQLDADLDRFEQGLR